MNFLPSSSPTNIQLLTTFLLISHFSIYGHAWIKASHVFTDKGDCAFDLGDYSFNLCPLAGTTTTTIKYIKGHEEINRAEGPSSGTRVYEIALGGYMSTEGLRTACGTGTWVCMTDGVSVETQSSEDEHYVHSKNKPLRNLKAQVTPVAKKSGINRYPGTILASIVIQDNTNGFSPLQLSLDGGVAEGRPQSAEIEMVCDTNVDSYLEFINERDGIHSFRWTTRHGCPTNIEPVMQSSRLFVTEDGTGDEESEKNEGDDELLPQGDTSAARRWMAAILVIVLVTVLCSCLFFASPRARHIAGETIRSLSYSLMPILSTAAIKIRPLGRSILALTPQSLLCGVGKPFRQGSNQLVRWAEEDMPLHETDDMMVNGRRYDEESWNGVEFNEHIPLTINPKHRRDKDIKSYGATSEVETFEQRGLMGGIGRLFGKSR